MASLAIQRRVRKVIDDITAALTETLIKARIDEPIDKAARKFNYQLKKPIDYRQIHAILSDFVNHIYTIGLKSDWIVSDPLAETLLILDTHYQGSSSNGYAAAMIDATCQDGTGLELVIIQLAQIIKTTERQKYVNGVFAQYLDPADWYLKCDIVRQLQKRYHSVLPASLLECSPEQLVDEIPHLISLVQNSHTILQEITLSHKKNGTT